MTKRYVLRVWGHFPPCGPFFYYHDSLEEARARRPRGLYDYEIARLPDDMVIEFGLWSGRA